MWLSNSAWSPDHFDIQYFMGRLIFSFWAQNMATFQNFDSDGDLGAGGDFPRKWVI